MSLYPSSGTRDYYVKDGKVQSILDQDYLKTGLEYVHGLYVDGLIDPAAGGSHAVHACPAAVGIIPVLPLLTGLSPDTPLLAA